MSPTAPSVTSDLVQVPATSSELANAIAVSPRLASAPAVADPEVVRDPTTEDEHETDAPWVVLVWNDPINLMSYVVYVFQKLFGYSEAKATELMLDVHHKGRAAVAWGAREKAELDVFRLHEYGLWATMQKDN